ncbi:TlpA family protein disulfide reductase [Mucilaginibacter segetis]|uniref:TlpA family protein disulfide reductase n=1 Tax=Mucilaginibacter segetis TaxID=2793071 RepID=A0A934PVY0_9SPHI|nr:TlpA disulfide reductase family protein [Mucilaginibacter segetis]MBK0380066.1 TlpA family protein disulfide reductase [Mucilaginibacter segetis]
MNAIYKFISFCFVFFYCFFNCSSIAVAQKADRKLFSVVDVITDDTAMVHSDSLEFQMSKNGINSISTHNFDWYDFKINAAKIRLVIPLTTATNYGHIYLFSHKLQMFSELNQNNNLFLFQDGDSVTLHLSNREKGAFFTGKDADKYNCMYAIGNNNEINNDKFNAFTKKKNYEDAYKSLISSRDSLYNLQTGILNKYKNKLNPRVYNLVKIDCWANCNYQIVGFCYAAFTGDPNDQFNAAAKACFSNYYANYKETLFKDTTLMVESYSYADFLNTKNHVYPEIMSEIRNKGHRNVTFAEIDSVINNHYQGGILKDKLRLLAFLDLDWEKQGDFANYLNIAINEAGNNIFKQALVEIKSKLTVGVNAFPFEMPDKTGKIYTLKDFKGKLLVIDFWFTGCHGCLEMAETLKPIAASYKSNPNIVFASISIDRNKSLWLKSLQSERYCSEDEINLMEGLYGNSAFIRHYNINEYPTLLIISKKGKVLSIAPPDPRSKSSLFEKFINQNL